MTTSNWEAKAVYIGDRSLALLNKSALIRNSDKPGKVLAQFDATFLPEAFGWHEFDRREFVNVVVLNRD